MSVLSTAETTYLNIHVSSSQKLVLQMMVTVKVHKKQFSKLVISIWNMAKEFRQNKQYLRYSISLEMNNTLNMKPVQFCTGFIFCSLQQQERTIR